MKNKELVKVERNISIKITFFVEVIKCLKK